MRIDDMETFYEDINVDDSTLINMLCASSRLVEERKDYFDNALANFDENNYDEFLISKLYYEFAKEEHDKIVFQVKKRNLEIS